MKKTIIGLWGTANVGKTMTLGALGKKLLEAGATTNNNIDFKEYRAIIQYKGKVIGLQTYGDHASVVEEGLEYFNKHQCEMIIMAAKSYGATTDLIINYASTFGYGILWFAPIQLEGNYSRESEELKRVKQYAAQQLLQAINDLISETLQY